MGMILRLVTANEENDANSDLEWSRAASPVHALKQCLPPVLDPAGLEVGVDSMAPGEGPPRHAAGRPSRGA